MGSVINCLPEDINLNFWEREEILLDDDDLRGFKNDDIGFIVTIDTRTKRKHYGVFKILPNGKNVEKIQGFYSVERLYKKLEQIRKGLCDT